MPARDLSLFFAPGAEKGDLGKTRTREKRNDARELENGPPLESRLVGQLSRGCPFPCARAFLRFSCFRVFPSSRFSAPGAKKREKERQIAPEPSDSPPSSRIIDVFEK